MSNNVWFLDENSNSGNTYAKNRRCSTPSFSNIAGSSNISAMSHPPEGNSTECWNIARNQAEKIENFAKRCQKYRDAIVTRPGLSRSSSGELTGFLEDVSNGLIEIRNAVLNQADNCNRLYEKWKKAKSETAKLTDLLNDADIKLEDFETKMKKNEKNTELLEDRLDMISRQNLFAKKSVEEKDKEIVKKDMEIEKLKNKIKELCEEHESFKKEQKKSMNEKLSQVYMMKKKIKELRDELEISKKCAMKPDDKLKLETQRKQIASMDHEIATLKRTKAYLNNRYEEKMNLVRMQYDEKMRTAGNELENLKKKEIELEKREKMVNSKILKIEIMREDKSARLLSGPVSEQFLNHYNQLKKLLNFSPEEAYCSSPNFSINDIDNRMVALEVHDFVGAVKEVRKATVRNIEILEMCDGIVTLNELKPLPNAPENLSTQARSELKTKMFELILEQCPICLCGVTIGSAAAQVCCTAQFHRECLKTWLEKEQTCPSCRNVRSSNSI